VVVAERRERGERMEASGGGSRSNSNNCTFVGQVKGGRREGVGVLVCNDGLRFEGNFKNNQIDGASVLDLPQAGGRWKGSLQRGVPQGSSTFTLPDGTTFQGSSSLFATLPT
jgi:hypothetical protein